MRKRTFGRLPVSELARAFPAKEYRSDSGSASILAGMVLEFLGPFHSCMMWYSMEGYSRVHHGMVWQRELQEVGTWM